MNTVIIIDCVSIIKVLHNQNIVGTNFSTVVRKFWWRMSYSGLNASFYTVKAKTGRLLFTPQSMFEFPRKLEFPRELYKPVLE